MIYPQTNFAAQKVSITNRYLRLFRDEHNSHTDGVRVRFLRSALNPMIPFKYHRFRLIYLSVIWNQVLSDIPESERVVVDAKFKEALQSVRKFWKWQRNHFNPTIKRLFKERDIARQEARQDNRHNPTLANFSMVNGGRKMNLPSKNPNVNEATNLAFAERFLHLHPDAPEDYIEAANEAIAEAKQQAYESIFWDDELDIETIRLSADMPEPPDPLEDFTTYIENDPGSDLSVISDTVNFTALSRNVDARVYKDFGIGHFGNFDHIFRIKITAVTGQGLVWPEMMANIIDDIFDIRAANEDYLGVEWIRIASENKIRLHESDEGTLYVDTSIILNLNTNYYINNKVVGTASTCDIYDDPDNTNLVDGLSLTLQKTYSLRYLYAINAINDGLSALTITGEMGDLDLQEVVAAGRRRRMLLRSN